MGVTPKLFSSSSYDSPAIPNPNPENFKIKRVTQLRNFVVAWIKYPDCTNYEGSKILVFKDYSILKLRKRKSIDPHFSQSKKFKSPIARFEPTEEGWEMALKLCII
ncbi:MAG: hypothetical protein E6R13_07190 [Spirochaetes bacterium]|nr:MAG: hypothetical protein E6R13_07190 [Spirochaetota bacterium]